MKSNLENSGKLESLATDRRHEKKSDTDIDVDAQFQKFLETQEENWLKFNKKISKILNSKKIEDKEIITQKCEEFKTRGEMSIKFLKNKHLKLVAEAEASKHVSKDSFNADSEKAVILNSPQKRYYPDARSSQGLSKNNSEIASEKPGSPARMLKKQPKPERVRTNDVKSSSRSSIQSKYQEKWIHPQAKVSIDFTGKIESPLNQKLSSYSALKSQQFHDSIGMSHNEFRMGPTGCQIQGSDGSKDFENDMKLKKVEKNQNIKDLFSVQSHSYKMPDSKIVQSPPSKILVKHDGSYDNQGFNPKQKKGNGFGVEVIIDIKDKDLPKYLKNNITVPIDPQTINFIEKKRQQSEPIIENSLSSDPDPIDPNKIPERISPDQIQSSEKDKKQNSGSLEEVDEEPDKKERKVSQLDLDIDGINLELENREEGVQIERLRTSETPEKSAHHQQSYLNINIDSDGRIGERPDNLNSDNLNSDNLADQKYENDEGLIIPFGNHKNSEGENCQSNLVSPIRVAKEDMNLSGSFGEKKGKRPKEKITNKFISDISSPDKKNIEISELKEVKDLKAGKNLKLQQDEKILASIDERNETPTFNQVEEKIESVTKKNNLKEEIDIKAKIEHPEDSTIEIKKKEKEIANRIIEESQPDEDYDDEQGVVMNSDDYKCEAVTEFILENLILEIFMSNNNIKDYALKVFKPLINYKKEKDQIDI